MGTHIQNNLTMSNPKLQREADQAKDIVSNLIDDLVSQVEALTERVEALTERVEELEAELNDAYETISNIQND